MTKNCYTLWPEICYFYST